MAMTRMLSISLEKHFRQRRSQPYTISSMPLLHIIGLVFIVIIVMSADVYGKTNGKYKTLVYIFNFIEL